MAAYRLLLRLLPAELRTYTDDMTALLAAELGRVRGNARASMMTWFAAAWDVVRRAPHEHWRRRHLGAHREGRMRSFITDLRYAVRSFARQKGSTAVILATLTLAVAANTAVFTLLDGLFLRPFPFDDPNRLAYLNEQAPKWNLEYTGINYGDFYLWRQNAHAFESMALIDEESVNLAQGGTADRVDGARVTHDLPAVLRIKPVLGRFFSPEEDKPKGPDVVVIGYGMWRSRFAGARDVVGRTMRINSKPHTIIGVMPAEAEFPGNVQLWLPLAGDPNLPYQSYGYEGIARLKPGVTIEQARQDLVAAHRAVYAAQRDTSHVVSPRIQFLRDRYVADFKTIGTALGAGGVLVLLIACANVAGAMLARAIFRKREIGIRMALGANASRLTRQLLTESLALAAMAGVAGTWLGWWGLRALLASVPDQLPRWVHVGADARVLLFSVAIVAVTAVLFGLIPALEVRRQDVSSVIGTNGTRTTGSVPQRRVLDSLVVVEIALAAVLLVGGALLVRAFSNLRDVDPGFRVDNVATFRVSLPHTNYSNGEKQKAFYQAVLDRLNAIPGVTGAGAITCPPLSCHWGSFYSAEGGAPPGPNGTDPVVLTRIASPGYFSAMGIKIRHGRFFTGNEGVDHKARVVVVNESFAKRMWPGVNDPTGKRISYRGDTSAGRWFTVLGVSKDDRHYGLAVPMRPGLYFPMAAIDSTDDYGSFAFAVHTAGEPSLIFPPMRSVMRELDPDLPMYQTRTMRGALSASLATRRAIAAALSTFATIALMLAVGGIYAVLSYVVGHRRREIGIRMALGAQRAQVLRMVVRQGLKLVIGGLFVGIPLSVAAMRVLSSLLIGVSPKDPLTYIVVAAILTLTGLGAAFVPARRAAGVDPTVALSES